MFIWTNSKRKHKTKKANRTTRTRQAKANREVRKDIDEQETLNDNYTEADIIEGIYTTRGQITKTKEILSILKGENHEYK